MKTIKLTLIACMGALMFSCSDDDNFIETPPIVTGPIIDSVTGVHMLSKELLEVRNYVPDYTVIAHRGTTYWTPESTEAGYRWARNMGADYLEADLQITKDGVIIVCHDATLNTKTDISLIYPGRHRNIPSTFDYEELLKLDASYPFMEGVLADPESDGGSLTQTIAYGKERRRESFKHLQLVTVEDLIHIAKGEMIERNTDGTRKYKKNPDGTHEFSYVTDPKDNGHRPGIYLEIKQPKNNPGITEALKKLLMKYGWDVSEKLSIDNEHFKGGKVNIGNTNAKVVLQTFDLSCLKDVKKLFRGKVPNAYLASNGKTGNLHGNGDIIEVYRSVINDGVDNLAQFWGPSIAGAPNDYPEMLKPWQADLARRAGMGIHPWTFDSEEQMIRNYEGVGFTDEEKKDYLPAPYCTGMFTNRADMTIKYYVEKGKRPGVTSPSDPAALLDELGYTK